MQDAEKKRLADEAKQAQDKADAEAARSKKQRETYEAKDAQQRAVSQKKTDVRLYGTIATGAFAVVALGFGIASARRAGLEGVVPHRDLGQRQAAYEASTRSQSVIADVSFALALAAGIAAVVLVPKGSDDPPKSVDVAFIPSRVVERSRWEAAFEARGRALAVAVRLQLHHRHRLQRVHQRRAVRRRSGLHSAVLHSAPRVVSARQRHLYRRAPGGVRGAAAAHRLTRRRHQSTSRSWRT